MPNAINYATKFDSQLDQAFRKGLLSAPLSKQNDRARFLDAKTVKIPTVTTGGYGEHNRSGGWNRKDVTNAYQTCELTHDRDVEFLVDAMDVDDTNQAVSAANITSQFLSDHAIPEMDAYRFSKLYAEYVAAGQTPDSTVLTKDNILTVFDGMMTAMSDKEVPEEGRLLFVTPAVSQLIKSATGITRSLALQSNNGVLDRRVATLDNVTLIEVPLSRMKTAYDFTDGFVPAAGAKQIQMLLVHPDAVVAPIKHSAIYLFQPGQHTVGDGYLYQNRSYSDLFLLRHKTSGVQMNIA